MNRISGVLYIDMAYFEGDLFLLIFAIHAPRALLAIFRLFSLVTYCGRNETNDALAPAQSDRIVHPFTKQVCDIVTFN